MDAAARGRYADLGVNRDRRGALLTPSTARLTSLTLDEAEAYASIATAGSVPFRRIEQEKINLDDAKAALIEVLNR